MCVYRRVSHKSYKFTKQSTLCTQKKMQNQLLLLFDIRFANDLQSHVRLTFSSAKYVRVYMNVPSIPCKYDVSKMMIFAQSGNNLF